MPEEYDVGQRDQDDFFRQSVFERVDGVVDQLAAVIEGTDRDPGRQPGRDFRYPLFHAFDDGLGILPAAHDHSATHCFMSVEVQRAAPVIPAYLHSGDVFQIDRRAFHRLDRDQLEILGIGDQPYAA